MMIKEPVHSFLRQRLVDRSSAVPDDRTAFFWVDWREDDDQVAGSCEAVLDTGELSADWVDDALTIVWRGQRTPVPLKKSLARSLGDSFVVSAVTSALPSPVGDFLPWLTRENRDITLRTLNQILQPDFEIRRVLDPEEPSEAAYPPLSREDWRALEQQYGSGPLASVFESLPPLR